ncbi:type II toxin-antitoxin system PemK/MazF family toxin [Ilumatobacter sp.]|uniref:type II toxin-antitoxin system PemK/MazF family toxin n=1 Tax=Ilumatobacter sp. TaxID=1967498 RepID=UPI003AF952B6
MRAGDGVGVGVGVDFGTPIGSEPGLVRPAVVATADGVLQAEPRAVHVVPLTSNTGRSLLTEVVVTHDDVESAAQVHLLTPISVQRIVGQPSDNVGALALAQLRSIVADLFDTP